MVTALAGWFFLAEPKAQAQDIFEIQVYEYPTTPKGKVTTQPRRGTRDTKGKRMEMSLMKPAKLTLVRSLSALVVRFVPFCGHA
jgi:hypothetical protein